MNYATAKAIINQEAPELHVDDPNPGYPRMVVVRKAEGAPIPFSITLPVSRPEDFQDIPARDAVPEQPEVPATDDHPGHPAIPAQPAQPRRTVEGQVAEAEKKALLGAIKAAQEHLA